MVSTPYGPKPKKKSHRRPHTSAGPSDKSNEFRIQPSTFERLKPEEGDVRSPDARNPDVAVADNIRLVAADDSGNSGTSPTPPSSFGWKKIVAPALSVTTSFHGVTLRNRDIVSDDGRLFEPAPIDQSQIRAWEEEVARIESQSRRTGKDIFSMFKRKRMHVAREG